MERGDDRSHGHAANRCECVVYYDLRPLSSSISVGTSPSLSRRVLVTGYCNSRIRTFDILYSIRIKNRRRIIYDSQLTNAAAATT